jgi:AAA+ ATPase superfamily predicted ATPase
VDKTTTSEQLWQWMLRKIGQHCGDAQIEQYIQELLEKKAIDNFALSDLFDSLNGKSKYIVLLLDEFENVTENPNFGPDFFYGLRSLATHHNFSLVTSSCRELIELCHSEAIRSSPFFNIFANINLRLFSEEEARQLISESLAETKISFTEQEIDTIFQIAGYHPFFLQAACHFLFDAYIQNLNPARRIEFMLREFGEEATPHLRAYWYKSDDREKILLTVLALLEDRGKVGGRGFSLKQLQDFYTRSPQTLANLEKRSLLVSQANAYSLFNSSFGQWICREITDTRQEQDNYQDSVDRKPV